MGITAFSLGSKRSSWELEAVPFPTTLHWHDLTESWGQWILQNATCKVHSRYGSFIRAWLNQPTYALLQSTLDRVLHFEVQPCWMKWGKKGVMEEGPWRNVRWAWSSQAALCSPADGGGSLENWNMMSTETTLLTWWQIYSLLLKCIIQPTMIKWQLKRSSAWHCSGNRGSKQPAVLFCC